MMPTRPRNVSCPSSGPEAKASTAERADPRRCHWGRGTDASRSPPWPHDVAVPPGGEGLGHRVPGPRKGRRRSVRWSQACPRQRASPQTEVLETASLAPNEAAVQGATNPTPTRVPRGGLRDGLQFYGFSWSALVLSPQQTGQQLQRLGETCGRRTRVRGLLFWWRRSQAQLPGECSEGGGPLLITEGAVARSLPLRLPRTAAL